MDANVTRRSVIRTGGVASALAALGVPIAYAAPKPAKIGILAPLTGSSAADGEECVRGATLAVEEINKAGGIAGTMLEIVSGDTGSTADAATSAFQRLSGDTDVNAMMAGYATGTNFEINLMAEVDMPYLVAANSAQTRDIIAPDPSKFPTVWSLTPSYEAYNTDLLPVVQHLADAGTLKLPNKKVALISSDNPYSKSIYEGLKKAFGSAGWQITVDEMVPFGDINDWRAFLARVRQDPPAIVVNTDYQPGNAATFMTQFMEQPTNSLVFIQYAPSVPEFINLTKGKSTGVVYNLLGGVLDTPANPRAGDVKTRFKARWGVESGTYGVALYEMAYLYADALKTVGDASNRLEIGKALGATDKKTAQGRVVFDPATHLARQGDDYIPIQFYQIWDGQRILFSPTAYKTGDFRMPPWTK